MSVSCQQVIRLREALEGLIACIVKKEITINNAYRGTVYNIQGPIHEALIEAHKAVDDAKEVKL